MLRRPGPVSQLSSFLRRCGPCVAFTLSAACAVPTYGPHDGGDTANRAPGDASVDAGDEEPFTTEDGAVIDPAEGPPESFPVGQYAVVARFYGAATNPGGGTFTEQMTVLADVHRVNNKLQMTWKTCAYDGRAFITLFPEINYAGVDATKFPVRTLQLAIDGNSFQTTGEASSIGYTELTGCPQGGTQYHPDRPWLSGGRCDCPSSTLLPTMASDCRVTDPDGDGEPGITVAWKGGTENFSHSRIRDSSQLLSGVIAADGRHTAQLSAAYDNYQLSCAREPCSRFAVRVCPPAQNPVRFFLLEAKSWTCAEVVSVVQGRNQLGLGPLDAQGC